LLMSPASMPGISLDGYAYNLSLSTLGNIIGGVVFVAGMYWMGSPKARQAEPPSDPLLTSLNGSPAATPALVAER